MPNQNNYNDTTPAAPGGKVNIKWQKGSYVSGVRQVSAYVDAATTSPYDFSVFLSGAQTTASLKLARVVIPRPVTFASGMAPSTATAVTAATGSTVFSLQKNGSQFGTITFAASGTSGTFAAGSSTSFNGTSDVLSVVGPATPDATLADIGIVLSGTR